MKIYHEIEGKGVLGEMTTEKLVERLLLRHETIKSQNSSRVEKERAYVANRSYVEEN